MPAVKSGNHINISGTGNTLESVTNDINDITFIEKVASSPPTYRVKGNVIRYLQVTNGGELIIGNAGDYSYHEILQFEALAFDRNRFNILTGGALFVYGDSEIDFSVGASYGNNYWDGKCIITGNATYRPILKHLYRIVLRRTNTSQVYIEHDVLQWDYLDIEFWPVSSAYIIFQQVQQVQLNTWWIKHLTMDGIDGVSPYGFYFEYDPSGHFPRIAFENIEQKNCQYGSMTYVGGILFKDCYWHDQYRYAPYCIGPPVAIAPLTVEAAWLPSGNKGQNPTIFDGCTFEDNYQISGGIRHAQVGYGALVMFKDCEFIFTGGGATYCITVNQMGVAWIYGTGNIFSGERYVSPASGGSALWVWMLDLTVQDGDGNPIEGAVVVARQKDGKEEWLFDTDSSGKVETNPNLNGKIVLAWREQLDYNGNSFTYWSDDSNGSYHSIYVFKEGYKPVIAQVVMSQDRTLTVTLEKLTRGSKGQKPLLSERLGLA